MIRSVKIKAGILLTISVLLILGGCGAAAAPSEPAGTEEISTGPESTEESASVPEGAEFPKADLSAYAGLDGYEKPLCFVEMTVADVARLMDEKQTFSFVASFAKCPWCNIMIAYLNDAALEAGETMGLIDTRKDPSWTNNMDIDDYDLFVELFGDHLETDEDGKLHLYTPHAFFIKEGVVVYDHQGTLPDMGNVPGADLTKDQEERLTDLYRNGFDAMRE